jgi:SAM-dependent methyltransferase
MRFYVLDDLVDPATRENLRVEHAEVVDRPGPPVEPCRHWCGFRGAPPASVSPSDCLTCRNSWVTTGELVAGARSYGITDGIPRLIVEGHAIDEGTQDSFAYEWQHFDRVLGDYDEEAGNYFSVVPAEITQDAVVLDAGCGMGRWARHAASLGVRRLYAVDFSRAIDQASRTLEEAGHAHCVQADLCRLPFRDGTFDFTYCLGVLHHLQDPDVGMSSLNRVTRADGALLVYLYYALDNRPRAHRWLLAAVTAARRLTSRLPKPIMYRLAWVIAVLVYLPLARFARLLERLGWTHAALQVPLSHYRSYSLQFMAGDAFDRFATPIEKRYSRAEIAAWLSSYGRETRFSDRTPFWVTLATPRS